MHWRWGWGAAEGWSVGPTLGCVGDSNTLEAKDSLEPPCPLPCLPFRPPSSESYPVTKTTAFLPAFSALSPFCSGILWLSLSSLCVFCLALPLSPFLSLSVSLCLSLCSFSAPPYPNLPQATLWGPLPSFRRRGFL